MSPTDPKNTQKSQNPPHTPGQTEGNRKGLDDQHASQSKERLSVAPKAEKPEDDDPIPTFDEGERRPSPIERSGEGGLRAPAPVVSANPKDYVKDDAQHTEATMPPGEGRDPKRNTM